MYVYIYVYICMCIYIYGSYCNNYRTKKLKNQTLKRNLFKLQAICLYDMRLLKTGIPWWPSPGGVVTAVAPVWSSVQELLCILQVWSNNAHSPPKHTHTQPVRCFSGMMSKVYYLVKCMLNTLVIVSFHVRISIGKLSGRKSLNWWLCFFQGRRAFTSGFTFYTLQYFCSFWIKKVNMFKNWGGGLKQNNPQVIQREILCWSPL